MPRRYPTHIFHMTGVENLPSIIERGLLAEAQVHPRIQVDIGDQHIKEARRVRTVGAPPGGVVADYAPF